MIPMWVFLLPYVLFFFLGFLFLIFNIFHVARFGLQSTQTTVVLTIYLVSFFVVAIFSVMLVFSEDWSGEIDPTEIFETFVSQPTIGL